MLATRIVEAIDVFTDRQFCSAARMPRMPPDQFCLDGFEKRLDDSVVIAIPFATYGGFEPVLAQTFLIIVRTILATMVRVMNSASRWLS